MVRAEKATVPLERATHAVTRRLNDPLDQVALVPDEFCGRSPEALTPESLQGLQDSLVLECHQVPIEFVVNDKNEKLFVKGHRRVNAMRLLADKSRPP